LLRSTPPTPHPQPRKINCTLQNALAEKGAWCVAVQRCMLLRSIMQCKATTEKLFILANANLHSGGAGYNEASKYARAPSIMMPTKKA